MGGGILFSKLFVRAETGYQKQFETVQYYCSEKSSHININGWNKLHPYKNENKTVDNYTINYDLI